MNPTVKKALDVASFLD